tara:strand:- start:28 stop:162 length:135 start_codon:yes stop_codon:yes gene_type:complete
MASWAVVHLAIEGGRRETASESTVANAGLEGINAANDMTDSDHP